MQSLAQGIAVAALELEPNNPHDANAIKVMAVRAHDGVRFHIGYLPRETAAALTNANAIPAPPHGEPPWPAGARAAWTAPGATVLLLAEGSPNSLNGMRCFVFCPPVP